MPQYEGFRFARHQQFFKKCKGKAGIENVFDQNDILPGDGVVQIFRELDLAS